MTLPVTRVTIHSQTSFCSSFSIAAVPAPTSTSALVESVHGGEDSAKDTTDVANHSVSLNSTGARSPKLITSMVGPLDEIQATEDTIASTSTPVNDLLAPVNSQPARSASTSVADPVSSDPKVDSAATRTVLAPVYSDPAAGSTTTSVADPLALVNSGPSTSVVNPSAPVDLEHETHPQFTSALTILGEMSARGVTGDQSVEESIRNASAGDTDVIMANDTNLPAYLNGMIGYLRGVAPDGAWQDLVTNFVAFEKSGHAGIGVSAL